MSIDTSSSIISSTLPPALAMISGLSFEEFASSAVDYGSLLRNRLAEVQLSSAVQAKLAAFPDTQHWMVICADDSPDTVAVVPIIKRMVDACPRMDLRIFREDDDLSSLMDITEDLELDLSDDLSDVDTPLLLILDEEYQVLGQWGPRPDAAERQLDSWVDAHPQYEALADSDDPDDQVRYADLVDELTLEMRLWYNSGLNPKCVAELMALVENLQNDDSTSDDDSSDNDEEE